MRNTYPSIARQISGAAILLLAAAGAGADSAVQQLPSVTLYGSSSLRANCPEAVAAIQEGLQDKVRARREQGVMQVRFTLEGNRVSAVQADSGPILYRKQVREIIGKLQCNAQSQVAQQHLFEIEFTVG